MCGCSALINYLGHIVLADLQLKRACKGEQVRFIDKTYGSLLPD
jgi:hypothetical protein